MHTSHVVRADAASDVVALRSSTKLLRERHLLEWVRSYCCSRPVSLTAWNILGPSVRNYIVVPWWRKQPKFTEVAEDVPNAFH